MYFNRLAPAYGHAYFALTIPRPFGFSPVKTQLNSVSPWAATFALSMIVVAASDYYKRRYISILPLSLISTVGLVVLLAVRYNVNAGYGALSLAAMGQYVAGPIIACWFGTNRESQMTCYSDSMVQHSLSPVDRHLRHSVGSCGLLIATFTFVARDVPKCIKGYSLFLGFIGFCTVCCTVCFFALIPENQRRAKGLSEHSGKSQGEKTKLGDLNLGRRYML